MATHTAAPHRGWQMDMEHDWKAQRTEAARAGLVADLDVARRCAALEVSLRFEADAHAKTKETLAYAAKTMTQHAADIAHLNECRRDEVAARDDMIASRDRVIAQQAATVGTLRAELAAAMRTIESWSADHTPALKTGLRRCDATFRNIDMVVDYDVVPGIDDNGEDCEAVETHGVWIGSVDVSALLSDEADESLSEQAQQSLDDWCADEAEELAAAGVPSLREPVEAL